MRLRSRVATVSVLLAALSPQARAAVKPGLEGAQELFRQNRWEDARVHLRSQWASLPEKDRPAATFLIGRAYVREAFFYRSVRQVEVEAGLAYLQELASLKANRGLLWLGLFKGLYQVEAERDAEAERSLLAASQTALPPEWKATARLRRAVALHRLGRAQEAAALKDPGLEARFWRLVLTGVSEVPPTLPAKGRPGDRGAVASRKERLLAAGLLFRAGRSAEAEGLLSGLSLDLPDVEDKSDPNKILRFHDPLLAVAWERVCRERAVAVLRPLASGAGGVEKTLAAYDLGVSLFHLGAYDEAARFLKEAAASSQLPELQPNARVLLSASSWKAHAPAPAELAALWESTQAQPDAVLLWDELRSKPLGKAEPFATKLEARLKDLLQPSAERPAGARVGRWGLARLRRGDEASAVVAALSEHRDKSNKNKLEWNDPLLLLALSAADYRDQEYAQSLETLFELSKTFAGLRALQWNLQGIYAARQKAGGEARISQ